MNEEDDTRDDGRVQHVLAIVFALFINALFAGLAILGALVIHAMVRAWRTGEAGPGEAIGIGLFGVLMAVIGGGFFYVAYVGAPRFFGRLDRQQLRPSQTTYSRGRVALPVRFDLPVDQPESGHILDDPRIVWKLGIGPASARDGSLKCEFQVPVFARRIDS